MYIKIKNNQIEKYPYSISNLRTDNPTTSFPINIPDERLAEWGVFLVQPTEQPSYTYKQNLVEVTPIFDGSNWVQQWYVVDKPQTEVDIFNESLRSEAYRTESDPLFFKYQRGEVDKQLWLDKVAEIKSRYN